MGKSLIITLYFLSTTILIEIYQILQLQFRFDICSVYMKTKLCFYILSFVQVPDWSNQQSLIVLVTVFWTGLLGGGNESLTKAQYVNQIKIKIKNQISLF